MIRKSRRLLTALLLCALLLSLFASPALAAETAADTEAAAAEAAGAAEPEKAAVAPEDMREVRVYLDKLLSGRALNDGERLWLAVEDLCTLLELQPGVLWNEETQELSIGAKGLVLHAVLGQPYFSVNSRYLYEPRSFFLYEGRAWFPLEVIRRIFSTEPVVSPDGKRVDFRSADMSVMPGGAAWYFDNFGSADIFWLARIIHSEAQHQPLEGRIGVGNVVLNRVKSDRYPDNIRDVVFDDQFAVQFDPAATGAVYAEPNEEDVICACLCFEGYNTVGESMFFVNPARADDSWFRNTKEFVVTIGDHDFYRLKG